MGACLLLRPKSRRSFRPAFRSRASLLAQPSEGVGLEGRFFLPERNSEALARAPKEIDAAASGFGSSSSEEEEFDYKFIRV